MSKIGSRSAGLALSTGSVAPEGKNASRRTGRSNRNNKSAVCRQVSRAPAMVRQHRFKNGSGDPANERCGFDRFPQHGVGDFVYARERQVIDNLIEFQVAAESVGGVRKTGRTQQKSERISS